MNLFPSALRSGEPVVNHGAKRPTLIWYQLDRVLRMLPPSADSLKPKTRRCFYQCFGLEGRYSWIV